MIPLLAARFALAALSLVVARNRPALRPAAVALCALAALAAALVAGLPPRLYVLAWVAWPGALAWLAVRAWMESNAPRDRDPEARPGSLSPGDGVVVLVGRAEPRSGDPVAPSTLPPRAHRKHRTTARPSALLALAWLAYACAVAAWRWRDPLAYAAAIRTPHVVAVGVAVGAWWWRRKDEGPAPRSEPPASSPAQPWAGARADDDSSGAAASTTPGALTHARAVAAVLAVSAAVDVVAGAWAGPWRLAAPVSWGTVGVVAGVLLLALRQAPKV